MAGFLKRKISQANKRTVMLSSLYFHEVIKCKVPMKREVEGQQFVLDLTLFRVSLG